MSQDAKKIEKYRGIIKFLEHAVRNIAIYPSEHPSVKGVSKRAFDLLGQILEEAPEVRVRVVNGTLYLDEYSFSEPTPYSRNFMKVLDSFGIDDLFFRKGVSEDEFLMLSEVLNARERSREMFQEMCEREGIRNIGLGREGPRQDHGDGAEGDVQTLEDAVGRVEQFFNEVGGGGFPSLQDVESLVEGLMKISGTREAFSPHLFGEKGYDSYTFGHCVNVGILSLLLARQKGLSEQDVRKAALAGLMHDIGKARVPPGIVQKPGFLTPRENEEMKSHADYSGEVVRRMGGAEDVAGAVENHHRFHDGGGYPAREDGENVPALAGLVSVADFFDAATAARPYRVALNPVEVMDYLRKERGRRFDPVHVDALFALLGPFPPGSVIRLSSNEIGVVVTGGEHSGALSVRMIIDRDGDPFGSRRILDLNGPDAAGRVVAGVVDPALYGLEISVALSFGSYANLSR